MSANKEPTFFYFEGREINFAGDYDNRVWQRLAVRDLESYQALFKDAGNRIKGEASTNYLYYHEAVPQRIYQYNPAMKLIAILRNPVDRAFSAFRHRRYDYRESLPTFEAALSVEQERLTEQWDASAYYFKAGLYSEALESYFRIFPREQVRVYIYETDIRDNIQATLTDIFDFLGVDTGVQIDTSRRYNSNAELQNPVLRVLEWTLIYHRFIQGIAKRLPRWISSPARTVLDTLRQRDEKQPEAVSMETRCRLQERYRKDILKTEALIGRDLSLWFSDEC